MTMIPKHGRRLFGWLVFFFVFFFLVRAGWVGHGIGGFNGGGVAWGMGMGDRCKWEEGCVCSAWLAGFFNGACSFSKEKGADGGERGYTENGTRTRESKLLASAT